MKIPLRDCAYCALRVALLSSVAVTVGSASVLFWNTSTSAPSLLSLDIASAINYSGIVVGSSGGVAAEVSISAPTNVITLSGLPPVLPSYASDINSSGQISGSYDDLGGYAHAFFWSSETGMQLLGNLGGNYSNALAINDAGQIVGQAATGSSDQAYLWSSSTGMVAVGNTATEVAWDINSSGQMACTQVPYPYTIDYQAICGPGLSTVAVLVGIPNNGFGRLAINDNGWIIGSAGEGFLWTPGGVTNFGTSFLPVDINNAGEVIGSYEGRPAVWTAAGGIQVLSLGSFGSEVRLTGINDNGQIVGDFTPVPEPSTLLLTASFLIAGFWLISSRKRPDIT